MTDQGGPRPRTRKATAEVERLLAYESIRQLVARYAVAVDSRDIDTLVGLFVEDVQVGALGTGRAALRKSFETSLRAIGVSILNVGTHVIDLADEREASGIVYCKGEIQDGNRWIHQAIVYDDRYRCVAGSWYFVRRTAPTLLWRRGRRQSAGSAPGQLAGTSRRMGDRSGGVEYVAPLLGECR